MASPTAQNSTGRVTVTKAKKDKLGALPLKRCVWLRRVWWWISVPLLLGVIAFLIISQIRLALKLAFKYQYDAFATVKSIFGQNLYDKEESGKNSDSWSYNVWTGVQALWEGEAYMLGIFVALWSGIWPYVQQLFYGFGIAICDCQRRNLPEGFEWVSALGRYSFIDVWMVLIMAVAVRFSLDETQTKEQQKLSDFVNVSTTVNLLISIQGYALIGTFLSSGAVFASQCIGFVLIQVGMAYTWLRTDVPKRQEHRSWQCLGFESLRPFAQRWRLSFLAHITIVALTFLITCGLFLLVYYALNMNIMDVDFSFNLDVEIEEEADFKIKLPGPIPDIKVPIKYTETFNFAKRSEKSYSVYSGLNTLRKTTNEMGESNIGLYSIGIIMIYYFTLIRIALLGAAWVLPMPFWGHRLLLWANEFLSLSVNMDGFLIAYLIMCPLGQLELVVDAAAKSFKDPTYVSTISFSVKNFYPGASYLIAASVLDQAHAFVLLPPCRRFVGLASGRLLPGEKIVGGSGESARKQIEDQKLQASYATEDSGNGFDHGEPAIEVSQSLA